MFHEKQNVKDRVDIYIYRGFLKFFYFNLIFLFISFRCTNNVIDIF